MRVYECKDGRTRVYDPETKKVRSYPRYFMEQHLGQPLSLDEDVHHIDENPLNNDISNLEIIKHGEHQRQHSQKYVDKQMVCPICKKSFVWTASQQSNHFKNNKRRQKKTQFMFCSRRCAGVYGREIQTSKMRA